MQKTANARLRNYWKNLKKTWPLLLLLMPAFIYVLIFSYGSRQNPRAGRTAGRDVRRLRATGAHGLPLFYPRVREGALPDGADRART